MCQAKLLLIAKSAKNQSKESNKESSEFTQYDSNEKNQCYYCGLFLDKLFPVVRGFAHSFKHKN